MDFDIPAQLGGMPQLFELLCEDADLWRARFIAIELLALLYEDSDFIFRFLPEGGKLPRSSIWFLKMNSTCSIR